MGAHEGFCPSCGAARQGDDRFCHRCGGALPVAAPTAESAPTGAVSAPVLMAAEPEEKTTGWLDFILRPTRLFASGVPPVWGVALALVALTGLGSGAMNSVAQLGMERALPGFISAANLPAEISEQLNQAMLANRGNEMGRTAGVLVNLASSIPLAIAGYLVMAGLFFGLGRWAGGRGTWEAFTRNYALLAIPEIPALIVNTFAVSLLLLPVPPLLLLLAGLAALLVGTLVWAWKIMLRYALLTGSLRVKSGRAAAIVAGWEVAKVALVTALVGGIMLVSLLAGVMAAGSGM